MPEEARAGHRRNIHLRFALAFKCRNAKRLIYHLRDENKQQKRTFLCEKLRDVRDKQKKRNTTPRMRSVAAKIVSAQQISGRHNYSNWPITVYGSLTCFKFAFLKIIPLRYKFLK